jgi:N-acetylmuramoyl-L-alanine amidase
MPANTFIDPKSGIIVIDPGHGGIDGGTNKDGILEKEINLGISKKLKVFLEQRGYKVIMTREEDISLENLDNSGQSRHRRDLNARVNIINKNNAQLFLSIHVNCNFKKTSTDGAIVFYNDKFQESKVLAYCIQRSLNAMVVSGKKRTVHDPVQANYFLLSYSEIPGVIVETAFISNEVERRLLTQDEFREQLAKAIADGVEQYLNDKAEPLLKNGNPITGG